MDKGLIMLVLFQWHLDSQFVIWTVWLNNWSLLFWLFQQHDQSFGKKASTQKATFCLSFKQVHFWEESLELSVQSGAFRMYSKLFSNNALTKNAVAVLGPINELQNAPENKREFPVNPDVQLSSDKTQCFWRGSGYGSPGWFDESRTWLGKREWACYPCRAIR